MAKKQATKATKAAKAKAPKTPKKKGPLARGLALVKRVLKKGEQVAEAFLPSGTDPVAGTPDVAPDPLLPQRVRHGTAEDVGFVAGAPATEQQVDKMVRALVVAAAKDFALLPATEYETALALPASAPQPGFQSLPAPLLDFMDDGSMYEWKHAAVIDGQVVLQGQRREKAPKGRLLRGAGRNLTAELQRHQQEIADAAKAAGQTDVPDPAAKPPDDHPANTRLPAALHDPGTPAEGRHFRALCVDDLPPERLRRLVEYLVAGALQVHTSGLMVDQLEGSTLDARMRGEGRHTSPDAPVRPLYPSPGSGGGLY